MALSANSKNTLNALLSLLATHKDPEIISTLWSGSRRLLSTNDKTLVQGILPTNGWSQNPQPTEAAALATLLADIAAN